MLIPTDKTDELTLASIGVEAVQLLCIGDFESMAIRFGYALALGRNVPSAIRDDLSACLAELGAENIVTPTTSFPPKVRYFEPNTTGLFAIVECQIPTNNETQILVEVIISTVGAEMHATLEQLSTAA